MFDGHNLQAEFTMRVYENDLMVEVVTRKVVVSRTFEERWINPILHPVTVPFEPWIKTKKVMVTVVGPSETIIAIPGGFICHPVMAVKIKEKLREAGFKS